MITPLHSAASARPRRSLFRWLRRAAALLSLLALPLAHAQSFELNLGASADSGYGIHAGLTLRNVTVVQGYSVDGRLSLTVGGTSAVNLDGLVVLATSGVDVYGGPGLSVGGFGLRPALTLGVRVPIGALVGSYGESFYRLDGGFGVRAGLTFIY